MSEVMTIEEMQQRLQRAPFNSFMGLTVLSADYEKQEIVVQMKLRPEFERMAGSGQFHGGVIAAMIDTVGQYVLMMMLGKPLATINLRTDYLRPATNTSLRAVGRVLRMGKSICVSDVEVRDDSDKLVAVGRANFAAPA